MPSHVAIFHTPDIEATDGFSQKPAKTTLQKDLEQLLPSLFFFQ
jgi:hypothetical protein